MTAAQAVTVGNLGHRYGDLCVHTHEGSSNVTVSVEGLRDRIVGADGQITRLTSGLPSDAKEPEGCGYCTHCGYGGEGVPTCPHTP